VSYSETQTQTYTIADIAKVVDCFAADLDMTAQATGLLSRELTTKFAADVKAMAQSGYLLEANIVLHNVWGAVVRAAKYEVMADGSILTVKRPGNNKWPQTPGGELSVVVRYTKKWADLPEQKKNDFQTGLKIRWTSSSVDLSFPTLSGSADRSYASNGWGMTKTVYQ
jgi:hypothetical protein